MFATWIFAIPVALAGALHLRPVADTGASSLNRRSANAAGQRGFSTLMLALIGLLAGSSLAVPAMQLAAGTLTSSVGPAATIDADSAAEHAMWRLSYDPTVYDEMTGSPPETSYILGFPSGDANVVIAASSDPPADNGLTASLAVTPNTVPEEVATTVTYTLTLTNDDIEAHDVTRFEADPSGSYNPVYLTGTTSGATTQDPVHQASKWRWELITPVNVSGFGGTTSISWQMSVNEDDGQYWTQGTVRVDNIGNVDAPLSGSVRATEVNDLTISTMVTPTEVVAGSSQIYTYTIDITNNGATDYTPEFVKHWTSTLFDHSTGTTTGISTADPSGNHDVINNRWEWTWNITGVTVTPSATVSLSFDMTATLLPNTYFVTSGVRVDEDENANGQETTASTGDTAPITVVRSFTITTTQNGKTVTVIAYVTASGVQIVSWVES
ncbi:MAG: hypothetical protein O6922_06800 [Chloroflexi bacterium]|nr:hypothetical protein [Chloroflexota bacterium]